VAGAALIALAAALQLWNEGRSLKQQRLLDAAAAEVVEIGAARVHEGNEGRLVFLRGVAEAEGELLDPDFNQPAEGLALRRHVEMFQWREHRSKRQAADTAETKVGHRYERDWHDEPVDHSRFADPVGHANPTEWPLASQSWRALTVRVGGFRLADDVAREIDGWKPMAPDPQRIPANLAVTFQPDGRYLASSADPARPQVGDLRISFERIPGGMVSLLAAQQGDWLVPWRHDSQRLVLVERGEHDAGALIDAARSRDIGLAWALRMLGFVAMWIGFGLLFRPLAVLFDRLPLAGGALRWAGMLVSGVLAALLSFAAIGSGFLFHRPWLLFVVLVAVAGAIAMLVRRRARSTATLPPPPVPRSQAAAAAIPPVPPTSSSPPPPPPA